MGQKFCTVCGASLREGTRFCENCGLAIELAQGPAGIPPESTAQHISQRRIGTVPVKVIAGIGVILIVAIAAMVVIVPKLPGVQVPGQGTPVPTPLPSPTAISTPLTITPTPPPEVQNPFPDALALGTKVPFGTGSVASEGTVYKYWINDTYEWHNDMDNKYYVQKPRAGNKYLFVFVQMKNVGDTRVWLPHAGTILVHYNGTVYSQDEMHYKPDKVGNPSATPVQVKEVQYYRKLNGDEYVEDFGYSHGNQLGYIYPGTSNAIDGYIIYEVPRSLQPDKTFVEIPFNNQDRGVWKLQ